jgi:hypothetical protein
MKTEPEFWVEIATENCPRRSLNLFARASGPFDPNEWSGHADPVHALKSWLPEVPAPGAKIRFALERGGAQIDGHALVVRAGYFREDGSKGRPARPWAGLDKFRADADPPAHSLIVSPEGGTISAVFVLLEPEGDPARLAAGFSGAARRFGRWLLERGLRARPWRDVLVSGYMVDSSATVESWIDLPPESVVAFENTARNAPVNPDRCGFPALEPFDLDALASERGIVEEPERDEEEQAEPLEQVATEGVRGGFMGVVKQIFG